MSTKKKLTLGPTKAFLKSFDSLFESATKKNNLKISYLNELF